MTNNPTAGDLQHAARRLHTAYTHLERAKYTRIRPEVPTHTHPGPTPPGTTWALTLDAELSTDLHEIARDLATTINHPQPPTPNGRHICQWLDAHAHTITTTIDWAEDLLDTLRDQALTIEHHTGHTLTPTTHQPPPPQPAAAIIQHAATHGHTLTRPQLRQWATRGHIRTTLIGGRAHYWLHEVLQHCHKT